MFYWEARRRALATVVARHLEATGLTITGLAERSGLSKPSIQHYVHGRRAPQDDGRLAQLARGLGVEPGVLLGEIYEEERQERP